MTVTPDERGASMHSIRDEPKDDHEAVQMLRADLESVNSRLASLLYLGFPPKGRSKDDKDAHQQWWDDMVQAMGNARYALQVTAKFSDSERR